MTTSIILGSSSPRRKEILNFFSIPFTQASPSFDENSIPFDGNPITYVCQLSDGKLKALLDDHSDKIVITADTIVYFNDKVYLKPESEEEAFKAISELSGKCHSVFTGVSVGLNGQTYTAWEETKVFFNSLTPEEIRHYHHKIQWQDKAGGYAIQTAAGLIVQKIDGCYYNVMGLPINTLWRLLKKFNVDLWNYVQ